jgi:thiol:disulfide interchange protein DsbC
MQRFAIIMGILAASFGSMSVWAAEAAPSTEEQLKNSLEARLPGLKVERLKQAPVPGWYEMVADGQILYVDARGQYLMSGQLFALEGGVKNLTQASMQAMESERSPMRKETLAAIPDDELVVYQAPEEKHQIDVFVDIDCGFCRKLHAHIKELNAMGITVRYLAFPRAGLGSDAAKKLESVWCSDDRPGAMTQALLERKVTPRQCNAPIAQHYALVRKFGLRGTPAIILANGDLLPGYMPPHQLLAEIEKRGL